MSSALSGSPPRRGRPRHSRLDPKEAPTPTHPRSPRSPRRRRLSRLGVLAVPAAVLAVGVLVAFAPPALAATAGAPTSLTSVIDNLRNWLVGILAAVATLFLTVGGLRYLTAGGDPGQVEKAKTALKSAAIGYALAALAPLLVSILASLF